MPLPPRNSRNHQTDDQTYDDGRDYGRDRIVQPQARGKAAAWDRWVAQGGELKTRSRTRNGETRTSDAIFKKGPMKGMTIDQAKQKFATMWDTAPEAVREKYATRARRGATASEVAEADAINGRVGAAPAKVTNASLNSGKKPAQVAAVIPPAATPAQVVAPSRASGDLSAQAKGTPQQQAQIAKMIDEGSGYATALVAPGLSTDGIPDLSIRAAKANQERIYRMENPVTPTASGGGSTPIGRFFGGIGSSIKDAADWSYNGVTSLGRDDVTAAIIAKREADQKGARDASLKKEADETAAKVAAIRSGAVVAPTPAAGTQAPAVVAPPAQVASPAVQPIAPADQVVGPPRPAMPAPEMTGPPRSAKPVPELTGQRVMRGEVPKGVNSLTGLPKGYMPGDDVSGMSQEIQQRAGESIRRQEQAGAYQAKAAPIAARAMAPANQVVPTPIVRGPASQPVRQGSTTVAIPGRVANDPNIIAKDNAAQAAYQASLSGGTSDADHVKATRGMTDIYNAASSEDKARLVANTLQRNKALPTTTTPISSATPRVQPVRKPLFAAARR